MNNSNPLESQCLSRNRSWLMIGLILLGLAYAIMLFHRSLIDPDEGRYSEIPREMVFSGHWDEMRMLGYRYYEKPPLTYWMVAPAIALFGASEWAVRMPLLLNILLLVGLLYLLIRPHWPGIGGGVALAVMLSMAGFFIGFCLVITDGFLTFWISLTCILLFWAFQPEVPTGRKQAFLLLAAIAAVLGFLTKGAVAVVLPGAILVVWLFWEKRWRALLTPAILPAGLVFLALLTPSLWWIEKHNPGFLAAFIFDEHLGRFLGTRISQLHAEPFWFYVAILPVLMLPWTLFIFRAVRNIVRHRLLTSDALTRFLVAWIVVVIVFFSAGAGKLISYILPAIPPLGLLLGRWGLAEPLDGSRLDRRLWNLGLSAAWLMVVGVFLIVAVSVLRLAPKLVHPVSAGSALILFPLALVACVVLCLGGFRHFSGVFLLAATLLLNVALLLSPLAGRGFNVLLEMNSANVYKTLADRLGPEDKIVIFGKYRPALAFYTRQLPYMCYGMNEIRPGLLMERDRPGYLWTQDAIRRLVADCPGRVYAVVATKDYFKKFLPLGLRFAPVDFPEDPKTVILELLPEPAEDNAAGPD